MKRVNNRLADQGRTALAAAMLCERIGARVPAANGAGRRSLSQRSLQATACASSLVEALR
jgi:hypothetical protein